MWQGYIKYQDAPSNEDLAPLWAHQSSSLATAYDGTRDGAQLDEAISLMRLAVQSTPQESDLFPSCYHNLGVMLARRYEQTASTRDLEESVMCSSEAEHRTPMSHPRYASRCSGLANVLALKYKRTKSPQDFDHALVYSMHAIVTCSREDEDGLLYVSNLGKLYAMGFEATRQLGYIERGIWLTEVAVRRSHDQPRRRLNWVSNLGTMAYWKYQHTADVEDHARAIKYAYEAVQGSLSSLPNHPIIISNFADILTHMEDNLNNQPASLTYYLEAWKCDSSPVRDRLKVAMKAAGSLIALGRWEETSDLLCEAVGVLVTVDLACLSHADIQHSLREFTGLATLTASAVLQTGQGVRLALTALERGRGIMADVQMRSHSEVYDGREGCGGQCCPPTVGIDNAGAFLEAEQAGFESECRDAAVLGPIVILVATQIRCDAILIRKDDDPRVIPLVRVRMHDISYFVKMLREGPKAGCGDWPQEHHTSHAHPLEWLWDTIAGPVLEALGFNDRPGDSVPWPRIWWIPTGSLSQLPIHAAGIHYGRSNETVIDRVVSSYSQSVTALIRSRRRGQSAYSNAPGTHLLVSMVSTPGLDDLPQVGREIMEVAQLSSADASRLGPIVTLQDPTKEQILHHMNDAHVLHFAGHGVSHATDPLKSCMVLKDWQEDPLTVEDILSSGQGRAGKGNSWPFLAYLSACSTGQHMAQEPGDESISLMSAFQLIGFRHTVANLWETTDELLFEAATRFYTELQIAGQVTDRTIAWSVHVTVRHLRDSAERDPAQFASWPAYVHSGP